MKYGLLAATAPGGGALDPGNRPSMDHSRAPSPIIPVSKRGNAGFKLVSQYQPAGDQPKAIAELAQGLARGDEAQVLLGITGSGKTFTIESFSMNVSVDGT